MSSWAAAHLNSLVRFDLEKLNLYPPKFGAGLGRQKKEEGLGMKPDEVAEDVSMQFGRSDSTLIFVVFRSLSSFLKKVRC